MTTAKYDLSIVAISDIHLGHRKTPTAKIIENLHNVLTDAVLKQTDILFIAGDLFDHALGYNDENIFLIQKWFLHLLNRCALYTVSIRILEGTGLHDRNQSKHLVILKDNINVDIDLQYIDKVYIEKNEKFGLNILYVPDEWKLDPDDTWKDVCHCLSDNGLESVDFSIMHGMFEYQVPTMAQIKTHVKTRYESITNYFIIIGHVHQNSHNGKVLAPGSFDRLTHGDEDPKGGWHISINRQSLINKVTFIENENACVHKTVDCSGLNFDSAIETISALEVPLDSHIRIKTKKKNHSLAILKWCKLNLGRYHWSLLISNKTKALTVHPITKISPIVISPRTIEKQIMDNIDASLEQSVCLRIKSILKEII